MNCNGTRPRSWSRRGRRLALPVVLAAAVSGCNPVPSGSYLRPSYPDASSVLTRAACDGKAGPPTDLTFTAPGEVLFAVSAQRAEAKEQDWLVTIEATPPSRTRFRFLRDTVEVADAADARGVFVDAEATAIASQPLAGQGWVDIGVFGPTPYEAARRAFAEKPTADVAILRLGSGTIAREPARVRVELPAVQTARDRVEPPPQTLAGDAGGTGYHALRTDEYTAELAQREAQCTAQTPQRSCENVARLDPYSFRYESGAFTWLGRFWTVRGETPETLHFELLLHARTTEPWRIAEPVLRVTDEATGATTTHRLESMQVSLRYAVPLDTRLQGRSTSLSIALPLRDSSRTFIQLPPYDVNGQRHEMQPIELRPRRFEGGLQPVNC